MKLGNCNNKQFEFSFLNNIFSKFLQSARPMKSKNQNYSNNNSKQLVPLSSEEDNVALLENQDKHSDQQFEHSTYEDSSKDNVIELTPINNIRNQPVDGKEERTKSNQSDFQDFGGTIDSNLIEIDITEKESDGNDTSTLLSKISNNNNRISIKQLLIGCLRFLAIGAPGYDIPILIKSTPDQLFHTYAFKPIVWIYYIILVFNLNYKHLKHIKHVHRGFMLGFEMWTFEATLILAAHMGNTALAAHFICLIIIM